ncbi:MAG TPA: hypothetical protein VID48_14135 [Solirubrobacteraceae bacterium]|jgi:hypothetical protein
MTADKSYQMSPIGNDVARYLHTKRMRLTDSSYRSYEFCLEKFVRYCEDLQPEDIEPPAGVQRLEDCLEALWGAGASHPQQAELDARYADLELGQIGLFVAPVLVLASLLLGPSPMALVFNGYELAALLSAALIVPLLISDGESTWFEGFQLIALYSVLGIVFYFA